MLINCQEGSPFTSNTGVWSICTGVHAHSTVYVDRAKDVVNAVLASMEGMTAAEYTFKRNYYVITLDTKFTIKIDGTIKQIDPQLLFRG